MRSNVSIKAQGEANNLRADDKATASELEGLRHHCIDAYELYGSVRNGGAARSRLEDHSRQTQ